MLERLLIVGLGSIGTRHARLARALIPGIKIAAWRRENVRDAAGADVDHVVTSLDEALRFRPQAAVVANPSSQHVAVAMPLAQAGVHLLMEKPLANATAEVQSLIDLCAARKAVLMTGYNLRFTASLQRFRELLVQKSIGRVFSVRAEIGQFLPSWRPGVDYRNSVSAQSALGGGVLLELSHEIDYLRWLFGEVEWISSIERRQGNLEIDVEDTAHLTMGFASQAGQAPVVAALSMDFLRHDAVRCCTVIGENGSLRWNALAGTNERFGANDTAWTTLFSEAQERDASYIAQWRHFLDCIAGKAVPLVSGDDGLAVLRIIEAARRSAANQAIAKVERPHVHQASGTQAT